MRESQGLLYLKLNSELPPHICTCVYIYISVSIYLWIYAHVHPPHTHRHICSFSPDHESDKCSLLYKIMVVGGRKSKRKGAKSIHNPSS